MIQNYFSKAKLSHKCNFFVLLIFSRQGELCVLFNGIISKLFLFTCGIAEVSTNKF